ncbi:ArsI/CadI family heavy metal resistance metalloenzyme [Limnoglobus roseus]|uniref:Methyltransferase domain-containing protein n=1 Tax=Limnoglobus roseus TaxID=2598579 RepID=A0A5C1A8B7_9BACT|nr:ArsI/CadI family heavy metal resistance metalloenzyme [Limnoglobus roseus]QEL14990.1 methyltransferase domain-containing protein [Limnoglobus roseus]
MTTREAPPVATRFHVGLHSSDLARSVRFYRALLGVEPAKHLPDVAKFECDHPPLVVGLYPSPQPAGGALNHVGLRFPDSAALVEVQRRLEEAGIATQRQEGVECCYARQTKFWVTDPDRVLWEIYTLHDDIDHSGFDDPPLLGAAPAEAVWQHRLTDPLPASIPHSDGTLDEVLLEGTFNAALPADRVAALVAEAYRALKPGGKLSVHGLVGDQPFPGPPKLPGMASLVQYVPVETEPLAALHHAGFGGLFYEKLGDIHCFRVNGVELRELRLHGWKPGPATDAVTVVYKGPFEHVADESGKLYRRGEKQTVPAGTAALLRAGPAVDQFAFLSK